MPVLVADAELALCQEDYNRALAITEDLLTRLHQYGMCSGFPEAFYLRGKALLGLAQADSARESYLEAQAAAEAIGSRRLMWRILFALSQLETDAEAAMGLQQAVRKIVEAIAAQFQEEHIDLRESFLKSTEVQAVLKKLK